MSLINPFPRSLLKDCLPGPCCEPLGLEEVIVFNGDFPSLPECCEQQQGLEGHRPRKAFELSERTKVLCTFEIKLHGLAAVGNQPGRPRERTGFSFQTLALLALLLLSCRPRGG